MSITKYNILITISSVFFFLQVFKLSLFCLLFLIILGFYKDRTNTTQTGSKQMSIESFECQIIT